MSEIRFAIGVLEVFLSPGSSSYLSVAVGAERVPC